MGYNQVIEVNDKMQTGYRYVLSAPIGENFSIEFKPFYTPAQMLEMGVFGGKYMTDCREEFPKEWFLSAKFSPSIKNINLPMVCIIYKALLDIYRKHYLLN